VPAAGRRRGTLGQAPDGITIDGHVLDQPQDTHAFGDLEVVALLQELRISGLISLFCKSYGVRLY
jgi:hypothetical protein